MKKSLSEADLLNITTQPSISSHIIPPHPLSAQLLNAPIPQPQQLLTSKSAVQWKSPVQKSFQTDPMLNDIMLDEFRKVVSPKNEYKTNKQDDINDNQTDIKPKKSKLHPKIFKEFIANWKLSSLSHFLLDTSVLVNYNHLILSRLQNAKASKFTPYLLFIFRRILQTISITLITLFLFILYAMYKTEGVPSNYKEIPQSLTKVRNVIVDEWLNDLLTETDKVFQRYTETNLESSNKLKNNMNIDIKPKHPIIIFPGISSSALELWQTDTENDPNIDCDQYSKWNLRQRLWGSAHCLTEMIRSPKCWLYHMMLNETTGMDPDYIKLRSIPGPTGSDYLFPSYWVWALVLDNLANIGYDTNQIYLANYDWRVSPHRLNKRDGHWERVKFEIEMRVKLYKEKVILIGHSMGCNMITYFMQWVISNHKEGGKGGKDWIDKHVDSFLSIGGPLLGAPKIVPMYTFGEALETTVLPPPVRFFKEYIVPRPWFTRWVRSVHGGMMLAPVGGSKIWGNSTWAPEDQFEIDSDDPNDNSLGQLLNYVKGTPIYSSCHLEAKYNVDVDADGDVDIQVELNVDDNHGTDNMIDNEQCNEEPHPFNFGRICCKTPTISEENIIEKLQHNYTINDWTEIIKTVDPKTYNHLMDIIELGYPSDDIDISDIKYDSPKYFNNVLYRPLPYAPNMKIYCMYGTNLRAERNYYFMRDYNASYKYPFRIDASLNNDNRNILTGVRTVHGDGTIPLISLGFMCAKGWKNNKKLNPSDIKTKIIEYPDAGEPIYYRATMRGGKKSGDHVDIMGNEQLITDILLIASGYGDDIYVPQTINSEIIEMSKLVDI